MRAARRSGCDRARRRTPRSRWRAVRAPAGRAGPAPTSRSRGSSVELADDRRHRKRAERQPTMRAESGRPPEQPSDATCMRSSSELPAALATAGQRARERKNRWVSSARAVGRRCAGSARAGGCRHARVVTGLGRSRLRWCDEGSGMPSCSTRRGAVIMSWLAVSPLSSRSAMWLGGVASVRRAPCRRSDPRDAVRHRQSGEAAEQRQGSPAFTPGTVALLWPRGTELPLPRGRTRATIRSSARP